MDLRWYQQRAIDEIRNHFAAGRKKVLLHLATGGGKTHIFSYILKGVAAKTNKGIMVVRGRSLVDQASKRLFREEVPHGVRMANHWNKNYIAPIQVCSIDTLLSRNDFPIAAIVVVDEAHLFTSDGCRSFMEQYKDCFVLAVTATPFTRESLRHLAEIVVKPVTTDELMAQGFLVRPRYFAPSRPDLKGVKTVNGDYVSNQLQERMTTLTGDIVSHWRELGENRPTVCFAVNINHSKHIAENFNAAGIPAEHIEADTSFAVREAAIERLRSGEIKILCNVGILCTGVDIPFLSCIIMARPTKSYNLYIQQAGRGTRPVYASGFDLESDHGRVAAINASEKKNFILLDHAANVLKHGFITEEHEVDLDGFKKNSTTASPKTCDKCYLIYLGPFCPECGLQEKPPDRTIEVDSDGSLQELKQMSLSDQVVQDVKRWKDIRKKRGYKRGWVYMQVKQKYGEELANELYPKEQFNRDFKFPFFK
jgi:DNA repair protein RadD